MKKLILLIFVLSIFSTTNAKVLQQSQPVTYTCVMHPEIHATKPGNCPKCGMTLIKEKPKLTKKKTAPKQDKIQNPKNNILPSHYLPSHNLPSHDLPSHDISLYIFE